MEFTAQQIAELVGGTVEGNPKASVHTIAKIEQAEVGSLSFLANPKYEAFLYTTQASILIVPKDLVLKNPIAASLVRVANPYLAFSELLDTVDRIHNSEALAGVQEDAFVADCATCGEDAYVGAFAYVSENVKLGKNVKIHPQAYIGKNVEIGDNTTIHAGVKVYKNCKIGENCIIHSGTIVGSDGFGFAPQTDGTFKKVPQIGNVIIENNVEIGSNSCIDRATFGSTILKSGVKLDNLIQVAHNVVIEENTVIAAQTGISGSTKIGKNCMVGGQVGFVGHIVVADGSKINAKSGISKNIKEKGKSWNGVPAQEFRASYKTLAHIRRIPQLEKRIKELEALVHKLVSDG